MRNLKIVATTEDDSDVSDGDHNIDIFNKMDVHKLKLSQLKRFYMKKDTGVVDTLSSRHTIEIDEQFRLRPGTGQVIMRTDNTMLDYHLTVANSLGLGSLLPAEANAPRFCFHMDLKRPHREFKGKHAMVGFDTKGKMLYIGQCSNEDVFLAMAPNEFLSNNSQLTPPGFNTSSPVMTRRHYRQIVMMLAFFLQKLTGKGYYNHGPGGVGVFELDLESATPKWHLVTNVLYV